MSLIAYFLVLVAIVATTVSAEEYKPLTQVALILALVLLIPVIHDERA